MSPGDGAPTRSLTLEGERALESGARLPSVTVAYRTWGRPSARGDNAVLVCHALTGSADVDRWWRALLGPGSTPTPAGAAAATLRTTLPRRGSLLAGRGRRRRLRRRELAAAVPGSRLATLASPHGHDAFLIEGEAVNALVARFRREIENGSGHEEGTWVA